MTEPKPSRQFEQLVARVERALAGQNAIVTPNDRIQDKDVRKRHFREIDISIRMTVGSAPVLVIIECRNRGRKQDIEWVEQVKSKRDGVGADKAVLVASHGLTTPAREKAAAFGIVVTRFNRITIDDIKSWYQASGVTLRHFQCAVRNADIGFRDAVAGPDKESFPRLVGLQEKILVTRATVRSWSIQEILEVVFARPSEDALQVLSTLTAGGPSRTLNLIITLSNVNEPFEFRIGETLYEVGEVRVLMDVSVVAESVVQPLQVFSYGQEGKPVLDVLDFRVPSPSGGEQTLSFQRNRETGIVSVQMGLPGAVPELLPEDSPPKVKRGRLPTAPISDALAEKVRTDKD